MKICGINFVECSPLLETKDLQEGLVLAPSGPGMTFDLLTNPTYRMAVKNADVVIPDSGAMVLAWNLLSVFAKFQKIERYSGLKLLRELLGVEAFRSPEATFWVMPNAEESERNLDWLQKNGFAHLTEAETYQAPSYQVDREGAITDQKLLALLETKKPQYIILNIGGGIQEPLGWWLKQNLSYQSSIICTGAAIAFLTGGQAEIPPWADRLYLGWLLRILDQPTKFARRYWQARHIFWMVWKYRDEMPPLVSKKR